jgi:hypothetical protein
MGFGDVMGFEVAVGLGFAFASPLPFFPGPSSTAVVLAPSVLRAPQAWSKPRLPSRAKRKERTERIIPPKPGLETVG